MSSSFVCLRSRCQPPRQLKARAEMDLTQNDPRSQVEAGIAHNGLAASLRASHQEPGEQQAVPPDRTGPAKEVDQQGDTLRVGKRPTSVGKVGTLVEVDIVMDMEIKIQHRPLAEPDDGKMHSSGLKEGW